MTNTADSPAAKELLHTLMTELLPHELQAPLPERYRDAQQSALDDYWTYVKEANLQTIIAGRRG
jgi:hypothetical protein